MFSKVKLLPKFHPSPASSPYSQLVHLQNKTQMSLVDLAVAYLRSCVQNSFRLRECLSEVFESSEQE